MIELTASYDRRFALLVPERLHREVHRVESRAAGGVDGYGRAAQVEVIGDAVRDHRGYAGERTLGFAVVL